MNPSNPSNRKILICFAVKQEAAPFREIAARHSGLHVLITGMGETNARRALITALQTTTPHLVLTCGLAGGLNPELKPGTVVFDADSGSALAAALTQGGAHPAKIHCAKTVATTAHEKAALRATTSADAVEMESGCIRALCKERNILSATVRVILDPASEDLPIDFNALMTPEQNLDPLKLTAVLLCSPGKIPALLRLQKQTRAAASDLAKVLERTLPALNINSATPPSNL